MIDPQLLCISQAKSFLLFWFHVLVVLEVNMMVLMVFSATLTITSICIVLVDPPSFHNGDDTLGVDDPVAVIHLTF